MATLSGGASCQPVIEEQDEFAAAARPACSTVTAMRGGHGVVVGRNERVRNLDIEVLSDHWYVLRKATFDYLHRDGTCTREVREAYDRGNGVVILLHDPEAGTVLLTRQFRLPVFLNGHPDGMLIEAPAGLLDGDDPEIAIRREAEEESGVRVGEIRQLFDLYMSPGSVTERVTFFAATYSHAQRISAGGGLAQEGEDIEVLELALADALAMVERGEINDGKSVLLLQWAAMQEATRAG
jgi:nudix-type nucleoside diphosphatase (YffH/AdpP family)